MQFMKLQIIRHESMEEYESVAEKMYEKAAKLTVPNIDNADIEEFLLSPLEFCIVLEYMRMRVKNTSWENKWKIYRRFVYYLENSAYGKLSKIKTYPKLVVCMYEDICAYELYTDEKKEMWQYKTGVMSYQEWMKNFCNRKYNSDFSKEMSRSVQVYLDAFQK